MLYEPTRFDALIDEPWVPARVEDAIAAIVADADAAFDLEALWPAHEPGQPPFDPSRQGPRITAPTSSRTP